MSNDLVTDQRVHRQAQTLSAYYDVVLVGRKLKNSLPFPETNFKIKRLNLFFTKGPLFYITLNLRLFFFLLFQRPNFLLANDLDTLLPNYLISRIKNIDLYYDSHEYFTGVPELQNRPFVRNIWKSIEKFILPKLKNVYTVNNSIANLYKKEYAIEVGVVRNLPVKKNIVKLTRSELGLPENKKIFIFQGAGINVDRGAEEALLAMKYLPDDVVLLFIGGGDVYDHLKIMARSENLLSKVLFVPKQTPEKLRQYTQHASMGLTLDKDSNINYRYSLPNKLFDYIQAGVPVLASKLVEIEKIINQYNIGRIIDSHEPELLANAIMDMLNSPQYEVWKNNTIIAAEELNWEHEKLKLLEIFKLN